MNSLVIPPSPNWYETSILACAPDNTLIYGAKNEIVVIYDSPSNQAADVKLIPRAHSQKVISVSVNKNWGQPNKLLVTASEDKTVKLWNIETMEKKLSHHAHKVHNKIVGATFAGDERVISVSEDGVIIVWNVSLNQTNLLKDIFDFKVIITCISTCPHATWLTAFGLKNGLVIVTDLRKQGRVLYKLRGHDKSVLSLAWCPAPVNVFPKDPSNYVGAKAVNDQNINENKKASSVNESKNAITDINNKSSYCKNEDVTEESNLSGSKSKQKASKKNLWTNLKHADDDEFSEDYKEKDRTHPLLKVYDSADDFLRECENLKKKILGTDSSSDNIKNERKEDRPVIKAKKSLNTSKKKVAEESFLVNKEDKKLVDGMVSIANERVTTLNTGELFTNSVEVHMEEDKIKEEERMLDEEVAFINDKKKVLNLESQQFLEETASDSIVDDNTGSEDTSEDIRNKNKEEVPEEEKKHVLKLVEVTNDAEALMKDTRELNHNYQQYLKSLRKDVGNKSENMSGIVPSKEENESDREEYTQLLNSEEITLTKDYKGENQQDLGETTSELISKAASSERKGLSGDARSRAENEVNKEENKETLKLIKDGEEYKQLLKLDEDTNIFSNEDTVSKVQNKEEDMHLEIHRRNEDEADKEKNKKLWEDTVVKLSAKEERKYIQKARASTNEELCETTDSVVGVGTNNDTHSTDLDLKAVNLEPKGSVKSLEETTSKMMTIEPKLIKNFDLAEQNVNTNKIVTTKIENVTNKLTETTLTDATSESESKKTSSEADNHGVVDNVKDEIKQLKEITLDENRCDSMVNNIVGEAVSGEDSTTKHSDENNKMENHVNESDSVDHKIVRESDAKEKETSSVLSMEEEPRKEFLLASSAREGNIYIWRAGTDGRMQTFLTIPNKPNHRKAPKSNLDKVWIVLSWVTPTMLLSTSKAGEVIQWTLPKPKDKDKQFRLVHKDHSTLVFDIASPAILFNEYNWLDQKKLNVWSAGQDRLLLNTSLSNEKTNLACYPTISGVECFSLSPLDPNRLAIGTGEGIVKIWDLSRPHIKHVVTTNFHQKIQSRVVGLAWHPTNELILAYGTLEGRVGCVDTSNRSKSPALLPNFFKTQIHKIEWGPVNGNKDELGLFVVAEGKLVAFNTKKTDKEPQEIDTPDNTYVYTFAWKPNYEMMLVSSKTGSLIMYSTDLKILSTYYFHSKLQSISWHPDSVGSDMNVSKYCYWFASIANSKEVVVYDFGLETDNNQQKTIAKYSSRGGIITCTVWSPFEANKMVIADDDGTAQIWNVESGTILSTYVNSSFEGISAVIWSPIDSDFIISAGKDRSIKIWRISEYPARNDKDILDQRKKVIKESAKELADISEKTQEEPAKINKSRKNNLLASLYTPKTTSQIVADLRALVSWKEKSDGIDPQSGSRPDVLSIFGSQAEMLKIISASENINKARGKYTLKDTLCLFKGDISSTIKEAIEEKRVHPWIIMMAPMVSPKLWQAACEVYAEQLSEDSNADPLEIVTCYLACHKIEAAINVLCESAMFREALALAKCRLPENDAIITEIIENWAFHAIKMGNFETAAQCYIFLDKYEEAASVLFRRSDVEVLKFATELAEKSGNVELQKAVLFRYKAFKAEEGAQENIKLPTKVEAILQKENIEKNGERNSTDKVESVDNGQSVDITKLQNGEKKDSVQECDGNAERVEEGDVNKSANIPKNSEDRVETVESIVDVEKFSNNSEVLNEIMVKTVEDTKLKRRSSSLNGDFKLLVKDTNNEAKSMENLLGKEGNETSGLLTTEDVKKLLKCSGIKSEFLSKDSEVNSESSKNAGDDNCFD